MKKFECVMLSAIIITLIVSSAQVVIADDKSGASFLTEKLNVIVAQAVLATSCSIYNCDWDPDLNLIYEVYLQSTVRDTQGQLLSVSESTGAWLLVASFPDGVQIPNLVDYMFDSNVLAEKKVTIIDNVEYEKIQFQTEKVIEHRMLTSLGAAKVGMSSGTLWKFCGEFSGEYGYQCVPLFMAKTPQIHLAEGNVLTNQWTILRVMN